VDLPDACDVSGQTCPELVISKSTWYLGGAKEGGARRNSNFIRPHEFRRDRLHSPSASGRFLDQDAEASATLKQPTGSMPAPLLSISSLVEAYRGLSAAPSQHTTANTHT
jgi:hypothetical protein